MGIALAVGLLAIGIAVAINRPDESSATLLSILVVIRKLQQLCGAYHRNNAGGVSSDETGLCGDSVGNTYRLGGHRRCRPLGVAVE